MRKVLSMFISCRDREVLSSKGKVLLLQSIGSKSRVKGVCERNSLYLPLSCRLSRDILRTTIFSSYFYFCQPLVFLPILPSFFLFTTLPISLILYFPTTMSEFEVNVNDLISIAINFTYLDTGVSIRSV